MHFCQKFGLLKLLTRREKGSQKGITEQEFGSQKGITGRELGSQISLPDENWVLNHTPLQKVEYLLNESLDLYEI